MPTSDPTPDPMEAHILDLLSRSTYVPLKPKALARKLGYDGSRYGEFRRVLRAMMREGRLQLGRNHTVRANRPVGTVAGIYRRLPSGAGFVRPHARDGKLLPEIYIRPDDALDAATGDEVVVRLTRRPSRGEAMGPSGAIVSVQERATRTFVGAYFERDGRGYVRIDGHVFSHSVLVGDPGAKGARPNDQVVVEMLRFPTLDHRGEGVIVEVLGPRGQPGVDTLSIIRALGLPDAFPEDVLTEARRAAEAFDPTDLDGREDFRNDVVITIDPNNARDFDDAVSLTRDADTLHWTLTVHIADVAHFCPVGGALDQEARKRGTSVYLPQRVLPMFPELISNGLASLQAGQPRYVLSARIGFTPEGVRTTVRFARGVIVSKRRFTYEEVTVLLAEADQGQSTSEFAPLLVRMRELALLLRGRRRRRGALELSMPKAELEYDEQGRVSGAHFAVHDVSHQIIEEFMLSANEAVADHFDALQVPFLRRVHPAPEPDKLDQFAEFARLLGYDIAHGQDRFALQKVLAASADQPDAPAVHYALLRSLKHAIYSPEEEGHYALASENYCHFTSPIRRYPDLTVHRLLTRWLRTGKAKSDETELAVLGQHCSRTERRAELAERELVKSKLLLYLSDKIGSTFQAIITGVADYGFFAQAETFPVEGLVHVSTLDDDYYHFDEATHTLLARRSRRAYRLGDRVTVEVVRVDLARRQLDFRLVRHRDVKPHRRSKESS